MRLIDADAVTFPTPHRKEVNAYMIGWNRCLSSVLQQPTIDAVPVVHGRWEHGREVSREYTGSVITGIFYENWHCSACGYTIDDRWYSAITYKYCPKCGAKMEEKDA